MKILLLTKTTPWCHLVQEVMRKSGHDVTMVQGTSETSSNIGNMLIKMTSPGPFDLIISYLCPWILDERVLMMAPRAINFHPAPPWHPGFAPYSFAIYDLALFEPYDGLPSYGVTVHEMTTDVDSGPILWWTTVPMETDDSVVRLQHRTMKYLFRAFMTFLENDFRPKSPLNAKWGRPHRTRKDFEALRLIPGDSNYTIEARIRACRYPGQPGAYFEGEVG